MSKKKITEKTAAAVLSALALGAVGIVTVGCNSKTVGYIDAPETLQAELGTYTVPEYEVVDKNGMVLYGYNVWLKSATNADGEALEITGSAVTVDVAGIYDFVYTAGKGVADVTVKIDFADRTAPVIDCDDSTIPQFFIAGNSYKVPQYTISGEHDQSKCWSKVFHIAEDKTETEVKTEAKRFLVDKKTGEYAIRIHVEDAAGNANDYEYKRRVDGPEHFVENKVLYFDEAFGARQVSVYQSDLYTGEYVSETDSGAHVYGDEKGAYKVSFDGKSETRDREGIVVMNVPAVIDLTDCIELEMYVYNDSDSDIVMGSLWWNDTSVKKGEWTRLSWKVEDEGWARNKTADNRGFVSPIDISGMTIRFLFDYGQKIIPNGDFYLSSMRVIPKTPSAITAGDNVSLDKNGESYFVGDTVYLTAAEISGKTFDCFYVDGKPIGGNNFVACETAHSVTAKYIDGALSKDNMTYGRIEDYSLVGSDAQACKIGESDDWALSFDVYGLDRNKWNYFGAYVGGSDQVVGFELNKGGGSGKLSGYGGAWKWGNGVKLSEKALADLFAATEEKPATVKYLRSGNMVKVFLEYDGVSSFIGTVDVVNTLLCTDNNFGLGGRKPVENGDGDVLNNVPMHNIKYVATAEKTELLHAEYNATINKSGPVEFENKQYRIGDTVVLSAPDEYEGKLFVYYEVYDKRLSGNSFMITEAETTVTAVYSKPCVVTLGEGLTVDGKNQITVADGAIIKIDHVSPAGKYFDGLLVDGEPVDVNTVTIDGNVTITAVYKDREQNVNVKLNDLSMAAETGGVVYNASQSAWRPQSVQYVDNFGYDGIDGKVDAGNSVKVTLGGGENSFSLANGETDLSAYKELYFYAYTEASGVKAAGWWCSDTPLVPGKWTKVSFDRHVNPTTIDDQPVWTNGLSKFAYRIMNGTAGTAVWFTAIYGVPYADVEVSVDPTVKDYVSVSGTFKEDHTITLSVNGAPQGKAFKCFTVNGTPLESGATTYKLTASDVENGVEIGAQFADVSTVVIAPDSGISTADGQTLYARGVKVKLLFDESKLDGKVVDYYLLDEGTENEKRIYNGEFTTTAATHSVKAVLVDPAAMTWADGGSAYNYETVMGDAAAEWKSREFDGEVYGSAEYWAASVDVKHTDEWQSFEFVQGSRQSIRVRFHNGGYCGVVLMTGKDSETIPTSDFTVAYPTQDAQVVNKLIAGATVTCVRNGGTISLYVDGYKFFVTSYAVDHTGDWFGVGHVTANDATKPQMTNTKFVTGKDKVQALLTEFDSKQSADQINTLLGATLKDSSTCEHITTGIPAGLDDERVYADGVLKVTAGSNDVGIMPGWTFDKDTGKYSEICFWVYMESESALVGDVAGIWWTGDTVLTANAWNKITLSNFGTAADDFSKLVLRVCEAGYLDGHQPIVGKTFYITSVYGTPKTDA